MAAIWRVLAVMYLGFLSSLSFASPVEITFRINEDLGTLDWNNGEIPYTVVQQLMEGLTTTNAQGEPTPAVATGWSTSRDKKLVTFRLNSRAKWSDGQAVCAQHFIDSWTRALSPEFASPYAQYLFEIEGARAYHEGKTKSSSLGLTAEGCHVLKVKLERPISYFPSVAAHWVALPIRKDLIEAHPKDWFHPDHLVTNGPYILKEWKKDQFFRLTANPSYFGNAPKTKWLKALVIGDDSTAMTLFRSGVIQWMKDIPFQERNTARQLKGFRSHPAWIGYFLGFNVNTAPFNDRNARCALLHALDRSQVPQVLGGEETAAWGWYPQGLPGSDRLSLPKNFDAKKAKRLFSKSTLKVTAEAPLVLDYYTKDIHGILMQWIQGEIKKNLGLAVSLRPTEGKSYWSKLQNSPPALFLGGTTAWFGHPYAFFLELKSESVSNWGKFSSKAYDAAANESLAHMTGGRAALRAQEELITNECAIIPLYYRRTLTLQSQQCDGIKVTPLGSVSFKSAKCSR